MVRECCGELSGPQVKSVLGREKALGLGKITAGAPEPRLARRHRLGQKQSVLIVLLVAAASYETQVGRTRSGKQPLFRQVMAQDGEDVVGLSQAALKPAMDGVRELEQVRKKLSVSWRGVRGMGLGFVDVGP